ncbi:MAG: hypothetical protein JWQ35_1837 [Bacteriovoracaceae bacterium]|nr:hypothetical protein [Bacteriovoracaceae bacterium]
MNGIIRRLKGPALILILCSLSDQVYSVGICEGALQVVAKLSKYTPFGYYFANDHYLRSIQNRIHEADRAVKNSEISATKSALLESWKTLLDLEELSPGKLNRKSQIKKQQELWLDTFFTIEELSANFCSKSTEIPEDVAQVIKNLFSKIPDKGKVREQILAHETLSQIKMLLEKIQTLPVHLRPAPSQVKEYGIDLIRYLQTKNSIAATEAQSTFRNYFSKINDDKAQARFLAPENKESKTTSREQLMSQVKERVDSLIEESKENLTPVFVFEPSNELELPPDFRTLLKQIPIVSVEQEKLLQSLLAEISDEYLIQQTEDWPWLIATLGHYAKKTDSKPQTVFSKIREDLKKRQETEYSRTNSAEKRLEDLQAFIDGDRPLSELDSEVWYEFNYSAPNKPLLPQKVKISKKIILFMERHYKGADWLKIFQKGLTSDVGFSGIKRLALPHNGYHYAIKYIGNGHDRIGAMKLADNAWYLGIHFNADHASHTN